MLKKVSKWFVSLTFAPERKKMSEIKDKILTESEALFMRYGFKSITMDDVARELGVSKKTVYQFFADKNDLVNQCIDHHLEEMKQVTEGIMFDKKVDAITVMLKITEYVRAMLVHINPSSMFDLKKYFKPAWDKLEADRRGHIKKSMEENFESGVKEGLYRKELDPSMIARLYIHLIGFITDPDKYDTQEMDIRNVHLEIVKYHLRSICTPKGQELLEAKLKELNK